MSKTKVIRHCFFCGIEFARQRTNQIYCCEEHKVLARRYKNIDEYNELHVKWCAWCGEKFTSDRMNAKFCSDRCRFAFFKSKPCKYCGEAADTKDHFVPTSFVLRMQDLGWVKNAKVIIPCCRECNSTAGDKVFSTIAEKRRYIHSRYRIKYKKLLGSPDWTPTEISELGDVLKSHIRYGVSAKQIMRARLRWPQA